MLPRTLLPQAGGVPGLLPLLLLLHQVSCHGNAAVVMAAAAAAAAAPAAAPAATAAATAALRLAVTERQRMACLSAAFGGVGAKQHLPSEPQCRCSPTANPLPTPWCSLWSMIERPQRSVHEMLPEGQVPHVDVFICTYSGVCIVRVLGQALLLLVPGTSPAYHLAALLRRGAAVAVSAPASSSLAVLPISSALLCRAARDREWPQTSGAASG